MVERPKQSKYGQELAEEYVDGERIVQEYRIKWRRDKRMELYAAELLELHAGSLELEAQGDTLDVGARSSTGLVEHVGHGVFVEHNTTGVDADSDKNYETITLKETRDVVRYVLDRTGHIRVAVVGNPGTGKTRVHTAGSAVVRGDGDARRLQEQCGAPVRAREGWHVPSMAE